MPGYPCKTYTYRWEPIKMWLIYFPVSDERLKVVDTLIPLLFLLKLLLLFRPCKKQNMFSVLGFKRKGGGSLALNNHILAQYLTFSRYEKRGVRFYFIFEGMDSSGHHTSLVKMLRMHSQGCRSSFPHNTICIQQVIPEN